MKNNDKQSSQRNESRLFTWFSFFLFCFLTLLLGYLCMDAMLTGEIAVKNSSVRFKEFPVMFLIVLCIQVVQTFLFGYVSVYVWKAIQRKDFFVLLKDKSQKLK